MKNVHKLSVVIVTYNSSRFIVPCINSILKSSYPKDKVEIIVVDNASEDNTVSVINQAYPQIRCIKNEKNIGFAMANNIGIKKTSGKYVLLLNPDTRVEEKTLLSMVSFMESHAEGAVATCKVLLTNGELDDASHRGFPTPLNALFYFTGLGTIFPNSSFFNGYHLGYKSLNETHEIDSCVGAFMMIRRSVGDSIGWLDEDYFWYGEDIDFCYRVKMKGWKVYFVPYYSVVHFKGASSGIKKHSATITTASKDTKRRAVQARFEVMETFYRKHYLGKYPYWLMRFVFWGIAVKRWWAFNFMHN